MSHGTVIGRISDTRLVSVYCSNTAGGNLVKKRLVALRFTNTVFNPSIHGVGEVQKAIGAAVDYSVATNSIAVGILDGGDSAYTTFKDGSWAQAVTRGPVAGVHSTSTVSAKVSLYYGAPDGHVDDVTGDGTADHGYVGYSLTAAANGTTTTTIHAFIATIFG